MRDFFINSFEKLVSLIIILMSLGVIIAGLGTMFGGMGGPMGGGGFLPGLAILIVGGINVILFGGLMYLGLGIYQNTKATAEAVKKLANRG